MADVTVTSARTTAPPFTITPLDSVAGAEIRGLDLRNPLDEGTRGVVYDAFLKHHILVFKNQDLTGDEQLAFAANWGEIESHVGRKPNGERYSDLHVITNLDDEGKPYPVLPTNGNYFWHTDKSYHAVPSLTTMLHARRIPSSGGDTEFANIAAAYDALPEEKKKSLEGLRVIHSWEASRRNTGNKPASEEQKRERPPVNHPLVRTHPDSGRKVLYVGMHTDYIEGMDLEEGRALLKELLDHATQRKFVHVHKWEVGDLAMWDNRCLLHRAVANFEMGSEARVLHRAVVKGSVPV